MIIAAHNALFYARFIQAHLDHYSIQNPPLPAFLLTDFKLPLDRSAQELSKVTVSDLLQTRKSTPVHRQ